MFPRSARLPLLAQIPTASHAQAAPADTEEPGGATKASDDRRPIGVFDSGVGGLTVAAAIRHALPNERIVYLGDTARVPYGTRSAAVVRRYARSCADFLLTQDAKMVVVACNTASAHALGDLQAQLPVPVVGVVEASAMAAAEACADGVIGVIGTEGTVASQAYQRALARLAPRAKVWMQACPLLVPLCEEGFTNHPATRLLTEEYLRPLLQQRIDALVLGCTHYPLLTPLLADLCGPNVQLINSATAVAQVVGRSLREARLLAGSPDAQGALMLHATDVTARFKRAAVAFFGEAVGEVSLVEL